MFDHCLDRRHFLGTGALNLAGLGLVYLLQQEGLASERIRPDLEPTTYDLTPKKPHHEPTAKAMISLFMGGGPSHLDMFDPKPMLQKYDGKLFPGGEIKFDNAGQASRKVMGTPFRFRKRGQSGIEMSDVVPHMAEIADDITLIRSMNLGGIRNHVGGMRAMNTGIGRDGRPALGSWLTYGLGSETQDLPAFVALIMGRNPPGSPYWSSQFLPSVYQGTRVGDTAPRIANLSPAAHLRGQPQKLQLSLLERLNRRHLETHQGNDDLQARIASYQLAARMQTAASEALDISRETAATQKMYGLDRSETRRLGEACLIARRLVERGVRFVQIWHYGWDMHQDIQRYLPRACGYADQPSAALVKDLKSRGMLDSTLVHWGGEMGRLPVVQNRGKAKPGRDHNTDGFSLWLAGGGVKAGHIHGATDDFGLKAIDKVVHHYDYLATVLHLLGLDAADLVYTRNGREETILNGQEGHVVKEVLA